MIVTLTANPSHDRTVNLAGPLERGAVQRAESVISQAGGKGVNISRACVAAGQPTIAVLPGGQGRPVRAGAARGRHRLPAGAPRGRPPREHHDHRARRHHHQAQQPRPQATPALLEELADALVRRAGTADWIVLAGSLPPGAPPEWYAEVVTALRAAGARVAVDTSDAPLKALVDAFSVDPAGAPHLMKPNGEELASFTGAPRGRAGVRPATAAAAAARRGRPGGRERAGDPGAARRRPRQRRRAPGTPPRRRRPSSAPSARATPASSATCSGTSPDVTPTNDSRSPWPTEARLRDFPARPSPTPTRCVPSSSGSRASTSPRKGDHDRPHHARPRAPRRRPRQRQARRHPRPRPDGRRRRPLGRPRPARRGRASPARAPRHRPAGWHRDPHCRTTGVEVPTLGFARLSPRSSSARRTARPTSPS